MAVATDTEVRPVYYSDIISLYCDDGPGFVYTQVTSSAHFSVAVSVQTEKDLVNPTSAREANPGLKNVHVATFQVLYPNKFKAQKNLQKLLARIGSRPQSELSSRELDNLGQAKRKYRAEQEDNRQEQNRQKGRALQYGQVVELLNSFTKQYLCVSTTLTSPVEPNNMQIKISDHGMKHCRFKVLPRYKVRSIGDKVIFGDQIQLESMKTDGQFVHCSRTSFSDWSTGDAPMSTEEGSKELNLSVTQSALTILSYFSPQKDSQPNAVQAGSIIRLFHGEVEGYLVAEGSFIEKKPVEKVHLRIRPVDQDRPKSLHPSTSAITYWQIELEKASGSGEVINWEQRCRLRHVCTRKYLCLHKEEVEATLTVDKTAAAYSLGLTDQSGLSTVFRLFSVIQESKAVVYDTYCRIEHAQSKRWLHALPDEYKRMQGSRNTSAKTAMENLEWDDAKLKQIGSSEVMYYDDAFTIQKVSEEHVDILNYTAGMVPVIEQYLRNRKAGMPLSRRTATRMQRALRELGAFQKKNGEPVKERQKLLRNLRIIDVLVEILKLHSLSQFPNKDDKIFWNHVLVWQAVYNLLEQYLVGNSRKNELYVAKYIPLFQSHNGKGLDSETTVMELVMDNRKIIDRIEESQIDQLVAFLKEGRDHRFLDFLGVLCVCDGVAIPLNQVYVTKKFLQENRHIVYLTECGDALNPPRDPEMVYVSEDGGVSWTALKTFAEEADHHQYLFLERQLDLFSLLCYGRNEYVIRVITEEFRYLTWKEAFLCMKSTALPKHLRAKYCNIIIGMFIDVGENQSVLDKLCLSYIFGDVEAKPYSSAARDPKKAISGAHMEFFPDLRDWIERFLCSNGKMQASEKDHNQLLTGVLRVLHYLVAFGYYANVEDIKALLPPLLSVMNGLNDEPFPDASGPALAEYRTASRFEQNENNKEVVNAKHMAMQIIGLLFNFRFNIRLERFIYEFRRVSRGNDTTPLRPVLAEARTRFNAFRNLSRQQLGTSGREYLPLMKSEKVCGILENDFLASFARAQLEGLLDESSFFKDKDLEVILKDLSNYKYDKMVTASMQLMSRYFSANTELFDRAVQAQVLTHPESIKTFLYVEKTLPTLRRLLASKMTRDQEIFLGGILDEYCRKCWIHSNGEVTFESHRMNQTILYNFGILADLFDILEKEIDIGLPEYEGLRKIFRKCFMLLQALARGNDVVQKRLYRRMDRLLEIRGAEPQMANALTEVFTGNQEMCMSIRNYQVQKVVGVVAVHQENASELLDLLNAIVKIEELDLPLKRNQGFVMTAINQKRFSVCGILEPSRADSRLSLLQSGNLNNPELNYLIRLVDLLATCAEGENRFIESMCQNVLTQDDLFEVLLDPSIIVACKRPFLRFLIWVYLNTAGGKIESGAADLDHDPHMWGFLKQITGALTDVDIGLRAIVKDATKIQSVQKSLRVRGRTKAFSTSKGTLRPTLTKQVSMTGVLLEEGFLMYLFDGVLPFLQVFYHDYFQPDEKSLMHRHEISTSRTLAETLISISDVLPRFVGSENQYQLMRCAVTTILARSVLRIPVEEVTKFDFEGLKTIDVRSPALKQYEREYRSEEDLNTGLNNFVINIKRAYQKKNTIRDQIGLPSDKRYCEDEDEDEPLPLGPEFQEHVKVFSKGTEADAHCEKLMAQLHIAYSSPELRNSSETVRLQLEQLSIRSLQVLRAILHNQIIQMPKSKVGKVSKEYEKGIARVSNAQCSLNKFRAAVKISPLLSHHNGEIVRETLAFLAALLYRGNRAVQDDFKDHFLRTRDERFFLNVQRRMRRSVVATRERRALMSQHRVKEEKSARTLETLRERTQGKASAQKSGLAAVGKVRDEFEMEELEKQMGIPKVKSSDDSLMFRFRDDGYIEIIQRILGFMCDGHNKVLQDYLREQPANIKSFNLVSETCDYLLLFYNSIHEDNAPLVIQTFLTLVELASGNQENQATLFDHHIIDMINDVMRMESGRFVEVGKLNSVLDLKQAAVDLLATMVERNDEMTTNLAGEVMETIDIGALYENMTIFKNFLKEETEAAHELAFAIQHVLLRFKDFGRVIHGQDWKFKHQLSDDEVNTEKQLTDSTMSVEIWDGEELQQVYFRVKDKGALREEVKQQLKWSISRESQTDKLRNFLEWSKDIEKDIHYQRKIRSHWLAAFFLQGHSLWYRIVLLLTLALNVFILSTWKAPPDLFEHRPEVADFFFPVLFSVGGVHLLFSICMAITFYLSNAHNFVLPNFLYLASKTESPGYSHASINVFGLQSMFYLLFVVASALSLQYYGFFYCLHLFIIVINNDILTRVLQSVTRNGKSLLWVAALMMIIIYVYSVVAFAFLRPSFRREDGLFCDNLGECFISSLKFGLLTGGGLGEALPPKTYGFLEPGLRTLFDLTYFIVITIIALNIVFGIIVDTFSELRDDKWKAQHDMTSVCFVCGNASHEFDKKGSGFENHVKKEHNMWAYLFFFIHLSEKRPNDYTFLESYVASKRKNDQIDFFPLNKAVCLNDVDTTNIEQMQELKNMIQRVLDRHEREDANVRRRRERQEQALWERRQGLVKGFSASFAEEDGEV